MSVISSLEILLKGNTAGLDAALSKSEKGVGNFTKRIDSSMSKMGGGAMSGLGDMAGMASGAFAGLAAGIAAAAAALVAFGVARMGAIEDTARLSEELGVSYNSLVGLQHAASQAGLSAEELDGSLRHLQRSVSEAAHGGGEAAHGIAQLGLNLNELKNLSPDAQLSKIAHGGGEAAHGIAQLGLNLNELKNLSPDAQLSKIAHGGGEAAHGIAQLGLNLNELKNLSPDAQLSKIADGLQKVGNHGDQARIAAELFGREGGSKLLPMLKDGSAGLARMSDEAKRLGLNLSGEQIAAVEKGNAAWKRMGDIMNGVGNSIAVAVAPWIEKATNFITNLVSAISDGFQKAQPYIQAVWDTFSGYYKMLLDIGKTAWDWLLGALKSLWDMLGITSKNWKDFQTGFMTGLFILQYAFTHWKDFFQLGWDTLVLGVVSFGNTLVHIFTKVIPATFTAFMNFAKTFFTALYENVKNNAQAIWDFIQGKGSHFSWTNPMDGWEKAINDIRKSTDRTVTGFEKSQMDKVAAEAKAFDKGLDAFLKEKMADFNKPAAATEEEAKKAMGSGGQSAVGKGTEAALAGSAQAYRIIAGAEGDKMLNAAQAQLKEAQAQKQLLDKIHEQLKSGGKIVKARI